MATTKTGLLLFDPLDIVEGTRLRRDLLLVDSIAVDLRQLDLAWRYAEVLCTLHEKDPAQILKQFEKELVYLTESGMVEEVRILDAALPDDAQSKVDAIEQVARRYLEKKTPYSVRLGDGSTRVIDPAGSYLLNKTRADLLRARWLATQWSTVNEHYVPFASGVTQRLLDRAGGEATALRVVLSNLPVPASDTPWDEVLAFKSDAATQAKLARLRGWMADMAASTLTEQQMQDKLEAALADYREHMRLCKVKTDMGKIEVLLVTTAEVLENVARLKFSEVVKKLFQVFKEDHSLMEAELKSEGRELAFIDTATARFVG